VATLNEAGGWPAGVYRLEVEDPALGGPVEVDDQGQGGPSGLANLQAEQLARRTRILGESYEALLARIEALEEEVFGGGGPGLDYVEEVLADEPWMYWRLGEATAAGVLDHSGNGRHVAGVVGTPLPEQASLLPNEPGHSMRFSTGWLAGGSLAWPSSSLLSLECWVRVESVAVDHRFVRRWDSTTVSFELVSAGSSVRFDVRTGSGLFQWTVPNVLVAGQAAHLVFVKASAERRLYVNGALVDSSELGGTLSTFSANVQVGRGSSGYTSTDFRMQHLALYAKALSAERIALHYQAGSA
jgi:hypothetical protein